jgi:general secretion pathway protein F
MEAFRYEALDPAGRTVSGVVQADTARQARMQVRAQGLLPSMVDRVDARARARRAWARGIPAAELSVLTRQLATLLDSGLTIEHALNASIQEATVPVVREVLTGVRTEIASGLSFAAALGAYDKSFPEYYRALVRGGEESGALPTVLQHLADYLDARQALKQKTGLALLYPALVATVAVLIVAGLLVYVVPQVIQVFQHSKQELPWLTRALIGLSDFLRGSWLYLAAAALGGFGAARLALRRDAAKRRWHGLLLRLPGTGPLASGINISRFASTLAILVRGGVPLLAALASASRVVTNTVLRAAVEQAVGRVREGTSLARALEETRAFPPLLIHLVANGEASGKLAQMLERAAFLETQALERRLAVYLTVLEPAMILVMGGIVLLIVLAILLPIIEINQLVR